MKRGTRIVLHLKEDAGDMADYKKLQQLIKQYSEFIQFPISLWAMETEYNEVPPPASAPLHCSAASQFPLELWSSVGKTRFPCHGSVWSFSCHRSVWLTTLPTRWTLTSSNSGDFLVSFADLLESLVSKEPAWLEPFSGLLPAI